MPAGRTFANTDSNGFVSMLILTVNVLLFIGITAVEIKNGRGAEALMKGPFTMVLLDFGSFYNPLVNQGEWWRFITPNFLHIGVWHILFNSYALYQIGPLVEELYGSAKFIFIYLLTGIFAFVASYVFHIGGAGASGAICGLIGLMAVYGYRAGGTFGKTIMNSMIRWAVIIIIFGFIIGANNVGHIGGLLSGAVLGFLLKGTPPENSTNVKLWNTVAVICGLLIVISFALVGKNYGNVQTAYQQSSTETNRIKQGGENIIALNRIIINLENEMNKLVGNMNNQGTTIDTGTLKKLSEQMAAIPSIDEKSDQIRLKINDSLKKLVQHFETPNQPKGAKTETAGVLLANLKNSINEFNNWVDSVLNDYGLIKTP
ncbi:MAG: rhomboid family intramembrane serine protease [Acidobacteriota bacterium]